MFFFLLKLFAIILLVVIVVGIVRNWQMDHSSNQAIFLAGMSSTFNPDGFYNGTVPGYTFTWLGKKFDALHQTGINVFNENGVQMERYPFRTYRERGLRDKNITVIAIDYNIPVNPFWLRPILDEIVQTAPNQYLGKLQLRLIPGLPFTLGFFELKK